MLRMILPEHAEIVHDAVEGRFMDDSVWRALGLRLLGEEEFARFIARDGLPLCHVRMFGGLEVTIGESVGTRAGLEEAQGAACSSRCS